MATSDSAVLDNVFGSLADPIRRDILKRLTAEELSVNQIAEPYDVSLAAVSKHLKVLERADLVVKQRRGKQQFVSLSSAGIENADEYLQFYKTHLRGSLDSLAQFLSEEKTDD
jgi:DNA-binding transcriptional ArsR family regulator